MSALAAGAVLATLHAGHASTGETILFWVLAPIMVLAGLGLLLARKAVHAALAVILIMICLAFLYVAQDAVFLGVVQVVVYTGAIMMLFLFVLMLVGVDQSDSLVETIRGQRWVGALAGVGLVVVLAGVVGRATFAPATGLDSANDPSNPEGLAHLVFGSYVFAFEAVGALLVTAALGALVLTHRRRLTPRVGQRERADARIKAGAVLTPLPAPGVYARHNAMDVPALGPDGRPLEHSVPRVLRVRGQQADEREYAARVERVLAGEWASGGGSTLTTTEVEATPGAADNPPPTARPEGDAVGAPTPGAATATEAQEEQG